VENTSRPRFAVNGRLEGALIVAILAVAWGFWLHRMGVLDHDDMLSNELLFAGRDLVSLVFRIPWPDQSPLYFLYLRPLRALGGSPWVVQFVNATLVTVTLAVTYRLALAFSASRTVAFGALLLGAFSPASLWLVRFGRMYTLQVLLSIALAAWCVLRYLEHRRRRDLVVFAVVSVLSIYTHFLGFLITARCSSSR
jgi:uncharacterized membrane protein